MRTIAVITQAGLDGSAHIEDNNPPPGPSATLSASGETPMLVSDLRNSAVHIQAKGFQSYDVPLVLPLGNLQLRVGIPRDPSRPQDLILPPLVPLVATLERIVATDHGLETEDGHAYLWAQADSFRALDRLRLGQDVDPVFAQLADCGANGARILMDAEWFETHTPSRPDTYSLIPVLAGALAKRGLQGQLCVFADWRQVWGGNLGRAEDHFAQTVAAMRPYPNLIGQLVNERNQHGQGFPVDAFALPDGILFSPGSNGTGDNPPQPAGRGRWRYNDLGSERNPSKLPLSTTTIFYAINGYDGEGSNPGYEGTRWCTVVSEPPGIGDMTPGGSVRSPEPGVAALLGRGCCFDPQGRACGGTAHFDDGIQSQLMRANTEQCVRAFLREVKS